MKISEKQIFEMIIVLNDAINIRSEISSDLRIIISKLMYKINNQQSTELLDICDKNSTSFSKSDKKKNSSINLYTSVGSKIHFNPSNKLQCSGSCAYYNKDFSFCDLFRRIILSGYLKRCEKCMDVF
jgi:hypothetical protein